MCKQGCALALALALRKIPVTVYEARPADSDVLGSGVVLTPNGLWVLDRLGVFSRIRHRSYVSTHRIFKNDKDETVRTIPIANEELYGYLNHRIWRKLLLDEMKQLLLEQGVRINYRSKYGGMISDRDDGVSFLINGDEVHASLLIGSDGIYSNVRKHLDPDICPEYTGIVGILSHIKRASVKWPYEDYECNATIQGKPGAIFWMAEDPSGVDLMIGKQVQYPQLSRDDLEALQADKEKLVEFYRKDYDQWTSTAQSIIDSVCANKEAAYVWPFMKMPTLRQWYSDTGRVILVGDGAHAMPPSSGQGINQALEDVYSLTQLLSAVCDVAQTADSMHGVDQSKLLAALAFWQKIRQERIDAVFDFATNVVNVERMSEAERQKALAQGKGVNSGDMRWLFLPQFEQQINDWVAENLGLGH